MKTTIMDSKTSRHGKIYIRANFAQASDSIWFASSKEDMIEGNWTISPFQVADAKHSRKAAAKLIKQWGR